MEISVDDHFARFGSKSYAIDKINSVDVREHRPHSETGATLCGLLAVILVLSWLNSLGGEPGVVWAALVVGAGFGWLAWWQWQRAKIRDYQLFLMTSSSEAQAFVSRDASEVAALRERIERSMARSSRGGNGQ